MFVCDLYLTSHAPQRSAAWVGRSGGPSRDGRRCDRPGGSVGRAPRPPNLLCRAARGGSVGRTCRVGNRSFYYRGSAGRDAMCTFNFAPPVAERSSWRRRGRAGTACAPDAGAGGSPGRRQRRPTGMESGMSISMKDDPTTTLRPDIANFLLLCLAAVLRSRILKIYNVYTHKLRFSAGGERSRLPPTQTGPQCSGEGRARRRGHLN